MKNNLKYSLILIVVTFVLIVAVMITNVSAAPVAAPPATKTPTPGPTATPGPIPPGGPLFYVDCSAGANGTGTQASPWNNLATVNGYNYSGGQSILFKRGTTCSGVLWPKGSGSSGSPITIGDYGTGALPIINGGSNEEAIKLYEQEYWNINNMETTGGTRYGIYINGSGASVLHYFHITNAVVHNVTGGTMDKKTTGLVVFGYDWNQQFDDILIDNVTAHDTTMWAGIIVTGKGWGRLSTRSNNVTINNTTVYNVYGDGIAVFSTTNALIQNSLAYETGNQPGAQTIGTPNGLWTWDCSYCTVQSNESYLNSSPGVDGGAFDIDYYSDHTILQYNYGHDNDAYCMAIFATAGASQPLDNNTMRYNICSNNGRDGTASADRQGDLYIAIWNSTGGGGLITNTAIYNNTFSWSPASTTYFAIAGYDLYRGGTGWSGTNRFMNNIIYSTVPSMLSMWKTGLTMDYNLWWYTGAGSPSFKYGSSSPYTSFSAYQSGSGQDAHGLYANPMLNDPTYHANGFPTTSFTTQTGSPAINAGTNLGSMGSHDFFGNAIPVGNYDIGAYEHP